MKIKNIKMRLILDADINLAKYKYSERKTSFIFNFGKFTFTLYKHTMNSVNLTGISQNSHFDQCKTFLKNQFRVSVRKIIIDNTLFSHKDQKPLNIELVLKFICKHYANNFFINFSAELFPALFIKPKHALKLKGCPTILLFRNSSFVLLGGKNKRIINKVYKVLSFIINKYTF